MTTLHDGRGPGSFERRVVPIEDYRPRKIEITKALPAWTPEAVVISFMTGIVVGYVVTAMVIG